MYAVPAKRNGEMIPLAPVQCIECGEQLYFWFDRVEGGHAYRYASCSNLHSIFFGASSNNVLAIQVDEPGYLIDDTKPGWEAQIPVWAK